MAQHVLKVSGTRGEVSPLAHARSDTEVFKAGLAKLRNWFVLREGGWRRRSGTFHRGAAKYDNKDFRIIDFVYSADQSYALEAGDEYVRFWKEDGQVTTAPDTPYEIVSPYTEDDVSGLSWVQSKDTIFIAYKSMTIKPQKLVRTGETSWAFVDVEFKDGPYLPLNDASNHVTSDIEVEDDVATNLTFETTENINGGTGFVSTDVGRLIRVQWNGKYSWGPITAVTDGKNIEVTWTDGEGGAIISGGFGGDPDTPRKSLTWRLGAFSDTTGYPGQVAFFQGRVVWSSTQSNPTYGGYTYSGLVETFSPSDVDGTVTDAHGGDFDIIAGDTILWMKEAPRLQIGTPLAIRSLGPQDTSQTFSPRNQSQRLEIEEGASSTKPAVVGPSTVHCSQYGHSLHDLFYDFNSNALINPDLSVASEHLFDSAVKYLTFQVRPFRRLFAVLNDGSLACTTVDRNEKVVGFSAHDIGGDVLTAQAVPGTTQTQLWMGVRRTINGTQKQYIETLAPDFLRGDLEDAFFFDCGATYTGAATNTVSGISWLPNTEVDIMADGKVLPRATVSGGGVLTLPNGVTAEKISYGIPIADAEGQTLRPPLVTPSGDGLGRKLKIINVDVDLYETKGLVFVSDRGDEDELKLKPASNRPTTNGLQIGTHRLVVDGSWTGEGQITFKATKPLPATIRAINMLVEAED